MNRYHILKITPEFHEYIRRLGNNTIRNANKMSTTYLIYKMLERYDKIARR